jgi:hypothetical protein
MDREAGGLPSAEVLTGLRSRKDFLKMMGAAGLGTAVGANLFLREAFALDPTGPTDPSFSFSVKANYSAFDVISDNFVEHRDGFDRDRGLYTILTPAPELTRGGVSLNNGCLRVSGDDPFFTLFQIDESPTAPYAAVIVDVRAFNRTAIAQNSVYAGLIKDASNYVVAWYNDATKMAGFDVAVNGKVNTLAKRPATLATPVRFAFVLNSKEITALADEGGGQFDGWKPLANYPNEPTTEYPDPATAPGLSQYVDLRAPEVLAEYRYGFGARGGSEATIVLDSVEAGYWGRAGVRDPHVVTWADGTPYIKDNKLYLTLTNAGLDFFATAHWGVYTLDLSDYTSPNALEEVGKLFFKRDGKVLGDHAGHIVYDDAAGNFLIGVSTWGDFAYNGVHVNYTRASGDVIHGVHVLEPQKLNLPTVSPTDTGTWDPHFVRIDGLWYVAFVDSPTQGNPWKHFPALAKGPDLGRLTLVGAESDLQQSEGMVMQKFGGKWYVLCSSGGGEIVDEDAGPATYRIYEPNRDESGGLMFFGELDAPYVSNIPHPMVTPLPVNGNTKWIMVTFDGTMYYEPMLGYGTHGDFYVMDGQPIEQGYEFPPREP